MNKIFGRSIPLNEEGGGVQVQKIPRQRTHYSKPQSLQIMLEYLKELGEQPFVANAAAHKLGWSISQVRLLVRELEQRSSIRRVGKFNPTIEVLRNKVYSKQKVRIPANPPVAPSLDTTSAEKHNNQHLIELMDSLVWDFIKETKSVNVTDFLEWMKQK